MSDFDKNLISELYKEQNKLLEAQKNYKASVTDLNNKINSLEPAKNKVSELKSRFHDEVLERDKKVMDGVSLWKGSTCNHFKDSKRGPIKNENDSYYQELDRILDEMEDKLTQLKNDVDSNYGLLGNISAGLRSVANKLVKAFN